MNRIKTYVLMVVDESGSMSPLAEDVRGGFNTYMEELATTAKQDGIDYEVSVTLFNTRPKPLARSLALADMPRLNGINYRPSGYTALYDAVCSVMDAFDADHPELGKDERVILSVQTDGNENASTEYVLDDVTQRLAKWRGLDRACLFVGAGPDVWRQAAAMGFGSGSTVSVASNSGALRGTYDGLIRGTRSYSKGGTAEESAASVADSAGGRTHG